MLDFRKSLIDSTLRRVLKRLQCPLEVMLTCVRWLQTGKRRLNPPCSLSQRFVRRIKSHAQPKYSSEPIPRKNRRFDCPFQRKKAHWPNQNLVSRQQNRRSTQRGQPQRPVYTTQAPCPTLPHPATNTATASPHTQSCCTHHRPLNAALPRSPTGLTPQNRSHRLGHQRT